MYGKKNEGGAMFFIMRLVRIVATFAQWLGKVFYEFSFVLWELNMALGNRMVRRRDEQLADEMIKMKHRRQEEMSGEEDRGEDVG